MRSATRRFARRPHRRLSGLIDVAPTDTGLHTIGRLLVPPSEADIAERAAARNVTVAPLARYCITPIATKGLVLGFSGVRSEEIRKGVEVLGQVLEEASRAPAPPSVDQRRGQVSETR